MPSPRTPAHANIRAWLGATFELQDRRHARLLPMEGLRGLAVTLVFLQHYTVQSRLIGLAPGPAARFAETFSGFGNTGVELFFVLSGYLIYGTLVRGRQRFAPFMGRRCQRIYPAFLVVFVLALTAAVLRPGGGGKIPADVGQAAAWIAANLALLPGLFPIVPLIEVAWSLSYEMFFYLATAILVLGAGLSRLQRGARLVILTLFAAAFVIASGQAIPNFPSRMMPFFAGMLLAEGLGARIPSWAGPVAFALQFAAATWHLAPGMTGEIVQTLGFFALCAVCLRGAGQVSRWMTWTPLRWLGNMSYSYYLVHGYVVRAVMLALAPMLAGGMPDWVFWTLLPAVYAATILGGSVLFLVVEKPISLRP